MSKQDTIISLLKEIDKNIDNVNNTQKVKITSLRVTNNCIEDGTWIGGYVIDDTYITNVYGCFRDCNKLITIDLSKWTLPKPTSFHNMFEKCSKLVNADVSNFDSSNVTDTEGMFNGCCVLEALDLTKWDLSSVIKTQYMFNSCTKLATIIGGRTIDDVINNNISCLKNLKVNINLELMLDRASLRAVINGLADLTGSDAQTLTLGETLIAKLTEEDIAIATAKNWTIA